MRKILLCLAVLMVNPAFAAERSLGVLISAGSSVTNATTATPFTVPTGSKISIQCDAIAWVLVGDSVQGATATASATGASVKLAADQLFLTSTSIEQDRIAMISASGTANCRVFERKGNEG